MSDYIYIQLREVSCKIREISCILSKCASMSESSYEWYYVIAMLNAIKLS